jgi:hypothetical protein
MGPLATYFRERDWCQKILCIDPEWRPSHAFVPDAKACCLMGGIVTLTGIGLGTSELLVKTDLYRRVEAAVAQERGVPLTEAGVAHFNDYCLDSKEGLLAFLDKYGL